MLVCFLLVFVSLPVGAQDERWDALKNLTRKRDYTILKRDRQCVDGEIAAVTDHNLTVKHFRQWDKPPTREKIAIERAEILRIGERINAIDVVYSGRSSWADVKALVEISPPEHALIVMKDGRRREGIPATVSDETLKFRGGSDLNQIPKQDIAKVYYVRVKPVSASMEDSAREMIFLDPRLWPHMLRIAAGGPPIEVRVPHPCAFCKGGVFLYRRSRTAPPFETAEGWGTRQNHQVAVEDEVGKAVRQLAGRSAGPALQKRIWL
jgi:hypothetical protein